MQVATQNQRLLAMMKRGHAVTPLTALQDLGIFRLASRIWDLRKAGHDIRSQLMPVRGGKYVAMYYLKGAKS